MSRIFAIMVMVGIFLYWLISLVMQTEEEYHDIADNLEDEWL